MVMLQKLMYPCPFCDKKTIEVIYKPSYHKAHTSRSSAGGKTKFHKVNEEITILVEKCPNCGHTTREIEKKWYG